MGAISGTWSDLLLGGGGRGEGKLRGGDWRMRGYLIMSLGINNVLGISRVCCTASILGTYLPGNVD